MTHNAPVAIYLATIERENIALGSHTNIHQSIPWCCCCWYICLKSLELSLSPLSFFKATQQLLLFLPFLFFSSPKLWQHQHKFRRGGSAAARYLSLSQELAITHIKWPTLKNRKDIYICEPAPKLRAALCALAHKRGKNAREWNLGVLLSLADYFIVVQWTSWNESWADYFACFPDNTRGFLQHNNTLECPILAWAHGFLVAAFL